MSFNKSTLDFFKTNFTFLLQELTIGLFLFYTSSSFSELSELSGFGEFKFAYKPATDAKLKFCSCLVVVFVTVGAIAAAEEVLLLFNC